MSALREAMEGLPDTVFADLLESEEAYLLVVDLPGTTDETIEVHVDDRTLHIEARREKSVPEGFQYVDEDRSLFLDTDLPLPPDAHGTKADATVDRGVLEVRLPKTGGSGGHAIPVEDAED
ncbi:MAG: Hsp20/alpha crystallin family protein [Halobacteriaceae archaeon]